MYRRLLFIGSALLLVAIVVAWQQNSRAPNPISLTPTLTGQTEYCITCHADLPEISKSHPLKVFGCVSCHGGERLALSAELAHSTMHGGANPSDLSVVEKSCGGSNCHSGSEAENRNHIQRVMTSIQSTYAGAIANVRFTFGAQSDLTPRLGIYSITDETLPSKTGITQLEAFDPAKETNQSIQKFGGNCLTCHINATPREGTTFMRQTGCAACHATGKHKLTTAIPYTQCNACHNRGNYDLRSMTFIERADRPITRIQDYYQPISQFTRCEYTLDCVDCHTRAEAMGDGDIHANQKDVQYIQCQTCHGTTTRLPQTKTITNSDDIALKMAFLNPVVDLKVGDTILVTDKGEPLWNTRALPDGTYELIGKATNQRFNFRPVMGSDCKQKPDEQGSQYCHTCHSVER